SNGSMPSMHGAIDDATGRVVALWLESAECLNGYFHVLEQTILRWGVPVSIYSDAHTIFFSPRSGKLTLQEEMEGATVALTQFGKALDILGVNLIRASSPQAKGRIERLWGTLQHRLVVDMRIAGIKTIDEANVFLRSYLQKHNDLFAVSPEDETSAFLPAPGEKDLPFILCRRENRKAMGDSTFSWKGISWMALDSRNRRRLFKRGVNVEVLDLMDGSVAAQYDGDIFKLVKAPASTGKTNASSQNKQSGKQTKQTHKPAPGHPWRDGCKNEKNYKRIPEYCLEEMPLRG
ncbi:MAG: integrase, partial [Thermovirgaceae bacterium]|nr:integrase [Thermovirgaceae bacterium]